MIDNYFKAKGHIFCFHDIVPESVESAYRAALYIDDNPSIFKPSRHAGPWDVCPVIGHRRREDILQDLSSESDKEQLALLDHELKAFEACFLNVGRQVPVQAVA